MKTKISLAALALAGAMLALPVSAQAHFDRGYHKDWRCHMFGWLDHSRCKKKVVKRKKGKKKVAKKAKKRRNNAPAFAVADGAAAGGPVHFLTGLP